MKTVVGKFGLSSAGVTYRAISSKSFAHRYLICAAMARGISEIKDINLCDDTIATAKALQSFGVGIDIDYKSKTAIVRAKSGLCAPERTVECSESGSTLRFLIPQALAFDEWVKFGGRASLLKRPLDSYIDFFNANGIQYDYDGSLPIAIKGYLSAGNYDIDASVSSQFASGLMMFLGMQSKDACQASVLRLGKNPESIDYMKMTAESMGKFAVACRMESNKISIQCGQSYQPRSLRVEGDYSQAAFFMVIGALSGGIDIKGLSLASKQADRRILNIIESMGIKTEYMHGLIRIYPSRPRACNVDVSQCPDIAPQAALLLSLAHGKSKVIGAKRLRYKESDRLTSIAAALNAIGARVLVVGDTLQIEGVDYLKGGTASSKGDHRIAMMLAAAAPMAAGDILIEDSGCVAKSYRDFFDDYVSVGGQIEHIG